MALQTGTVHGSPSGSGVGVAKSRPSTRARGLSGSDVLPADFYARPVLEVARDLIGCVVDYHGVAGRIVETEAYHECEPACHAFVGVTPRTRTLFDEPGLAYVYRSYGIHALLNAVCEQEGVGAAVLIRALEPLDGIEQMRARRGRRRAPDRSSGSPLARSSLRDSDLCSGPGKLTQALGVELSENATSLVEGPVAIRRSGALPKRTRIVSSTRIGITKAVDLRWRFCLGNSPYVSRPWPEGLNVSQRRASRARGGHTPIEPQVAATSQS